MAKLKASKEIVRHSGSVEEAFKNIYRDMSEPPLDRVTISDRQLVDIPLNILKPYSLNEFAYLEDIEKLATSIHEIGLINPIVAVKDFDGKYSIFSGFSRFKAYELLNEKYPNDKYIKILGYIVSRKDSDDPEYLDKIRLASNINTHR